MILQREKVGTATNFLKNWRKGILMTGYKVITLPMAEEDIADQTDYIAFELKSPETAVNMVRGFKKVINSLSLFPQSHELDEDEELAAYGIRKIYYKNYKIYFLIDERERTVYILRVFHMLVDSREKILRIFRA
ncbi:MAG: type II toxin-antitoxin system RelE/ParE family toxin [Muribaculaceae bacterium]|nr:type II toxin-antitoxin system RelE/ParE family toxin [Roseburia sp.]MCM1430712.1 type II toxin-antitoxin system RelE/ParE family toxin [Muribaculaceae bacterium]MCM1491979.1 type II toxin-antitoxin system RelE/ParE family toxin [Muribaculaceae bacterium]